MMVTPWRTTASPGTVSSQSPPCAPAMSTMTLPGFIVATISALISLGAGRPGMSAVVVVDTQGDHDAGLGLAPKAHAATAP